jgi:hypothetical protein
MKNSDIITNIMSEQSERLTDKFEVLSDEEKLTRATKYWQERLQHEVRVMTPQSIACKCAIVVPVYNEDVYRIQKQLMSLLSQNINIDEFEVIYVVNNDIAGRSNNDEEIHSNNKQVIDYINSLIGVPVYVIDKSTQGNEIIDCNVGRARNRGVAEASRRFYENDKNGIIIQTDADTYFEDPDYLQKVISNFSKSSDLIGVAGGLIFEFDPDVTTVEDKEIIASKVERLIYIKIWGMLQAFLSGDADLRTTDKNFSGAHMLSRSFETAVIGGLHDVYLGEDPQFGNDLSEYAKYNGGSVIGMKDDLVIVTALRASDRTGSSLKKILDSIDLSKPLIIDDLTVDDNSIEELEKEVLKHEGGQELIERMRKSLHSLRMAPTS